MEYVVAFELETSGLGELTFALKGLLIIAVGIGLLKILKADGSNRW